MINHLAFIMDGNRRYAKKNNISIKEGYKLGMQQFLNAVKFQTETNIFETSFWALSTENWKKRSKNHLEPLYELITEFFKEGDEIEKFFLENQIKIELKGDVKEFEDKKNLLTNSQRSTFSKLQERFNKYNQKLSDIKHKVNICVNYGGQREIVDAVKKIISKGYKAEDINEKLIKEHIYFSDSQPPEIIIRPGDAPRLSGFMSWDCAYSEIHFTKKLWPELTRDDFQNIVDWFTGIKRNFGK